MPKKLNRNVLEAVGELTNAPAHTTPNGFGFVTLDDGTSVYIPNRLIVEAGIEFADIGYKARVRYTKLDKNRTVAARITLIREDTEQIAAMQEIADMLGDIESKTVDIFDLVEQAFEKLRVLGCVIEDPDIYEN